MKEDSDWFSNWEEQLPSLEELMPLSQSLITPNLASAFGIPMLRNDCFTPPRLQPKYRSSLAPQPPPTQHNSSSTELCGGGNSSSVGAGGGEGGIIIRDGGDDESSGEGVARTLKRPRLVWTPQLHKRFVDAVGHLGIKNAVPKSIMTLMSVDGLTRENVASHLQKYRLYLKRMQDINNGPRPGTGTGDSVTDRLFASSPVPANFLNRAVVGQGQSGHYHRELGQFDHISSSRQAQLGPFPRNGMLQSNHVDEYGVVNNGRKVLTLFPNVDE